MTEPRGMQYIGEHAYNGPTISVSSRPLKEVRDSAKDYLRYGDAFAATLPGSTPPQMAPAPILRTDPTSRPSIDYAALTAAEHDWTIARSIPMRIAVAPWHMLTFRDASFVSLCESLPSAVLFLLLAYYFIAGLYYESVGDDGLFEDRQSASAVSASVWYIANILMVIAAIIAEGRETWLEILRVPIFVFVAYIAGALLFLLHGLNLRSPGRAFLALDLDSRRRRMIPFGIGMSCLVAGALWGIQYSVFRLMLLPTLLDRIRGCLQAAALGWMVFLIIRIAVNLYGSSSQLDENNSVQHPKADDGKLAAAFRLKKGYERELAKALAFALPPIASQILAWFTSV